MISRRKLFSVVLCSIILSLVASGCSITIQKGRRSDIEKIDQLNYEIDAINARLAQLQAKKKNEISELERAKKLLEKQLKREIGDKEVRLEMAEKGLTIIFLAEVLFDSGKAELKKDVYGVLDKIAKVFRENLKGREVGIEGHTDNEPIKHSGWKSNWELSTARATSVLHYLVDEKGVQPDKISATGYGEHRTVASNDAPEGRRQNRRVEIVVLPKNMEKIQADIDKIAERKRKIERRLRRYKK